MTPRYLSELVKRGEIKYIKIGRTKKFHPDDVEAFVEDREWQINSWKENQSYFMSFLKKNSLSKLYAFGSYYYLLFKIFNLRDLNINLLLAYLIFYPYNLFKKILSIFKKKK